MKITKFLAFAIISVSAASFIGCGSTAKTTVSKTEGSLNDTAAVQDYQGLKRTVAIARFSNETEYAKGAFYDKDNDPIGKQAIDILSAKLSARGKFVLLERADADKIQAEVENHGGSAQKVAADYLIIGSITEFGRKTTGEVGLVSRSKKQTVEAGVNIRLVDVATGQIIYSEEGKGEAETESSTTLGMGGVQGFDATLSDKAISAAIEKLVDNIEKTCMDRPWKSYFLSYDKDGIIIAGGEKQGVKVGSVLPVYERGKQVKNPQTGMMIELPGKQVAKVTVVAVGGANAAGIGTGNECGSACDAINITNSTVTAHGGRYGAGIGSGYNGNNVSVTINGGTVVAFGKGKAAGIGGGENSPANVTVTGGDIQALSGNVNVGIGGGYGSIESDSNISVTYTDDISIRAAAYYGNLTLEKALTDSGHSFVVSAGVITDKSQLAGNTMVPYAPNSITYVSEGNGTVTGPSSAYYGEEIAPTFKADKYYKFHSYNAQPDGGTTLDIYNNKFTMPAKNVTVTARFVDSSYYVKYLDENGIEQTVKAYPLDPNYTEYDGGWYIVDKDITYTEDLKFNGTANLILANGVTLSVTGSSAEIVANTLNIYWQNHKNGALNAQMVAFNLNIYGGVIYPKNIYAGYNLNIYDGNIDVDKISCAISAATVYGGNLNITKDFYSRGTTLGYSKASDSIYAEAYSVYKGDLKIAEGQIFTDGKNTYSGTVTSLQIEQVTLTPYKPQAITYASSEHGAVTGIATASAGAEVTLKVTSDNGYTLDSLTVKDGNNNNITVTDSTFIMPESDVTVTATFKKADLNITYNIGENGTVEGLSAANLDDEIMLTVTPDTGYEIDTLTVKDSDNNDITVTDGKFVMPASDVTVTATFKPFTYTVEWIVGGSVAETDENVPYGTMPEFNDYLELYYYDENSKEYIFSGWSPDVDVVTGNITYTALYKESGRIYTNYVDKNGNQKSVVAKVLTGAEDTLDEGWYIVNEDVEFNDDIILEGTVNLIIGDNVTLSSSAGFTSDGESELNIYRQILHTGMLNMTSSNTTVTSLNVYGGKVNFGNVTTQNTVIYGGIFRAASLSATDNGDITLGCNTMSSNIKVDSYNGTVKIAENQILTDAISVYSGTLSNDEISAIEGKTITTAPYFTITWVVGGETVETDENVLCTTIPEYNGETPADYTADNTHYTFIGWNDGENIYAEGELPAVMEDVTYTAAYTEETVVTPADDKYNLTLTENIDVNILIDVEGHAANGEVIEKIVYTYPDITTQSGELKTETVTDITADINGYFTKSFTMAMAQAGEPITATLYYTNGETKVITVSVASYCKYIIDNAAANGYSDKLVDLCYTVLEYGKTAKDYFDYSSDAAYPEYTLPEKYAAVPTIESSASATYGDVVTGITGTQVYILSKATLRLILAGDAGDLTATATVNGKTLDAKLVQASGNKWAVDVSGLYATDLNKPIVITLSDGTTINYAATDWAKSILTYSSNAKSKALAKALYYYSEAANNYFGG